MKKRFLLIFTIQISVLCLTACSFRKVVGIYTWHNGLDTGIEIKLNQDNSFEYDWYAGLIEGNTTGYWKKKGNKVILNSERQPFSDKPSFYLLREENRSINDSISIKVFYSDSEPVQFADCVLLTDSVFVTGGSTNNKGEVKLPLEKHVNKLTIGFIGCRRIEYRLEDNIEYCEFKLEDDDNNYTYFTNKELTYKRERLYDKSLKTKENFWDDYYKKVE